MATPICSLKIYTSNGIEIIPIYAFADVTNNKLRIYTNNQVGAFELVDSTNNTASIIRIFINGEIKAIGKVIQGITVWKDLNSLTWSQLNRLTWGDLKTNGVINK